MIAGTTVDHVAMIYNLYEYPEYLRVVSSQLFYNRVLHKGSLFSSGDPELVPGWFFFTKRLPQGGVGAAGWSTRADC